eukprot:GCRY01002577.1.p1 GENE.GCRY01002577.1~~GCRY01002577.1.p1  ORF type:complete len:196 (+),score=42.97 GCRY01002577.1:169-756(+)
MKGKKGVKAALPRIADNAEFLVLKELGKETDEEKEIRQRKRLAKLESKDTEEEEEVPVFSTAESFGEAMALGISGLHKKDRRKAEQERLKKLGCTIPKDPKMPITMLKGIRAAAKKKEAKQIQHEKDLGIFVKKKEVKDMSAAKKEIKQVGRADAGLGGKFTRGVLHVSAAQRSAVRRQDRWSSAGKRAMKKHRR